MHSRIGGALVVVAGVLALPLGAQGTTETKRTKTTKTTTSSTTARGTVAPAPAAVVYVVRQGADTLLLERAWRTADSLVGEVEVRGGNMVGARVRHVMQLDADGSARGIDIVLSPPGSGEAGAPPGRHVNVRFVRTPGGGTVAEIRQGTDTTSQGVPTEPGAIPLVDASIANLAHVLRRARAIGGDTASLPLFLLNGGRTVTTRVVRQGADSVVMLTGDTRMVLRVDAAGEVVEGGDPSRGIVISRGDALPAPKARPER